MVGKLKQLNSYMVTYSYVSPTFAKSPLRHNAVLIVAASSCRQACSIVARAGWGLNKLNIRARIVCSLGMILV